MSPVIRRYTAEDWPSVWAILEPIVRAGEAYAVPLDMTEQAAQEFWLGGSARQVFVVELERVVVATYYLKPNQQGPGDHVCNCGYAVSAHATGRGLASLMCAHSLSTAKDLGYLAVQFNFVVSTNSAAIHVWRKHGFEVVGTLPGAFRHPGLGFVDVYVMFRKVF